MHTQKQKDTINFLESLVHNRFNIDTLNTKLSEFFNEEIKAELIDNPDDEVLCDWNIMFNSDNEETYGYFDIYVLMHNRPSYDGATFYVTEIGYEFE
jgi:hypothetical protein